MHVVVAEPQYISDYVLDKLLSLGSVELLPSPPELSSDFPDCDILMIRLGKYIGPELLGSVPSLKFIVSATTGLDHIDLEATHLRGIKISQLARLSSQDCCDLRNRRTYMGTSIGLGKSHHKSSAPRIRRRLGSKPLLGHTTPGEKAWHHWFWSHRPARRRIRALLSECGCLGVISNQVRFNSRHSP